MKVLTPQIREELFPYLAKAIKNQGCQAIIVGGFYEHIHLLVHKKSTLLTSDLVKEIKRTSSMWLKEKGVAYGKFNWQIGYGAFSVSFWDLKKIVAYIKDQDKHHQEMKWEDEYRKLLKKHGIEFDERYYLD